MAEEYLHNEPLKPEEREAIDDVRRRSMRSRKVIHQITPLLFVALFGAFVVYKHALSVIETVSGGFVVLWLWNSHRQTIDDLSNAINGLCNIVQRLERTMHGKS